MTTTALTQELKPSYIRYTLKQQNNRVEYRILSSKQDYYCIVQMSNGRAINCYHENGEKCQARHFHPGVPCKHMERANVLEQARRVQAKEQEATQSLSEEVQELIKVEQAKCQQVWQEKMSFPINAEPGTKKWYQLADRRAKHATIAFNLQRAESQRIINEAIHGHSSGEWHNGYFNGLPAFGWHEPVDAA